MGRETTSATPATRQLDERGVEYATHRYDYKARGGAVHAAECLGVAARLVVKTLVMRTDAGRRLLVLMRGDCHVSAKRLAREVGARRVFACTPDEAFKATGYVVGGISPFGARTGLPIYAESSIFEAPRIFINGGRRGLLLELESGVLRQTLELQEVAVASPV